MLEAACSGEGVTVMLLDGHRLLEQVAEYVAAGNSAQFPAWQHRSSGAVIARIAAPGLG